MKLTVLLFSLTCNQLQDIASQVEKNKTLTSIQKIGIIQELQNLKPDCNLKNEQPKLK